MFNDITKILQVIKKGIVIMEDGKPSFVLVPWEDIAQNNITASEENEKNSFSLGQSIDDTSLIQKMINYDSLIDTQEESITCEREITDMLNAMEEEEGDMQGPHVAQDQVNLEDLPF